MLTFLALSAALMQEPPAPAAPPAPEVRTRVMIMGAEGPGGLDADGDGQITREEFSAPMNGHFARMDTDGDGRLSTAELTAGHGAMAGGAHDVMMMRGAGVHRFEMRRPHPGGEAGAHAEHSPGRRGDGPMKVVIMGGPGEGGEREIILHGGPGGHGAMAGAHAEGGPGERIEIRRMGGPGGEHDLDVDDDGRISEAEFSAPLREAFARMDADRSGFIEAGERGPGHGAGVFVHRIETRQNGED